MSVTSFMRNYRKLTAAIVIVLALWGLSALQNALSVSGSPGPETVAIVQTPTYPISDAALDALVREAVAKAGGLDEIISTGDLVVVKPNLTETMWQSGGGVITDKRVVRTVVQMALEAGAGQVVIAEGTARYRDDGGTDTHCTRKAFYDSGLTSSLPPWPQPQYDDATGAPLEDLNLEFDGQGNGLLRIVTVQNGLLQTSYYVPKIIMDCDVLISVPILKNHELAGVTGSMKNRIGCAPNDIYHAPWTNQYKWGLVHDTAPHPGVSEYEVNARAITDLNQVRPSDFTVMDALIGVTNGPVGGGNPITHASPKVKCIIAGRDSLAVDTIESLVEAYDPSTVLHHQLAASVGLGQNDTALITVVGDSVAEVRNLSFPTTYGSAQRVELQSPSIGGMTPTNNSNVYGTVEVELTGVTDNVGVVKAELYVDDELVDTDIAAPYALTWDSSGYALGAHAVKAKVYDAALNEASRTHTLILFSGPVDIPPELDPIGNKAVDEGQELTFTVTAQDDDGVAPDLDWDGDVDQSDFGLLQVRYGEQWPYTDVVTARCDFNRDGLVNYTADYPIFEEFASGPAIPAQLKYRAYGLPSGAEFDAATQTFTWTPGYDQSGDYQTTFDVWDAMYTDEETITITVSDVTLSPPEASVNAIPVKVETGQTVQVEVSGSSSIGLTSLSWSVASVDGSAAEIPGTVDGVPVNLAAEQDAGTGKGAVSCTYTRRVTIGEPGEYLITAVARDETQSGVSPESMSADDPSTDSVAVTVTEPNAPPVIRFAFNVRNKYLVWLGWDQEDGYRVTYSYRIDGGEWSAPTSKRWLRVKDLRLRRGAHVLDVKAIDSAGLESAPKPVRFYVRSNRIH